MRLSSILAVVTVTSLVAIVSPASAQVREQDRTPAEVQKEIDRYFGEIDLNRDERLTKLEMSAFATRHRIGVFVRPEVWKKLDADRSGSLSRKEFADGIMEIRAKRLAAEASKTR